MFNKTAILYTSILLFAACPLAVLAQPQALQRVPSDCLFCVQLNDLDATLGQMERFLEGITPAGSTSALRARLGQLLSNPTLAGIKTTGTFLVLASSQAGKTDDPKAWLNSICVLVPTSDYGALTNAMPQLGPADANGTREIAGTGLGIQDAGGYALIGRPGMELARLARALRSGTDRPLGSVLDQAQIEAASRPGLWCYLNVQGLAKVIGPGVAEQISQIGRQISRQAGPAAGAQQLEQAFAFYGAIAQYVLDQVESVTLALRPRPDALAITKLVYPVPGGQLAQACTRTDPTGPWRLLGYCQDGAVLTAVSRIAPQRLADLNLKVLEMMTPMLGRRTSQRDQQTLETVTKAMGQELAVSVYTKPGAKPFFGVRSVFLVSSPEAFAKMHDAILEAYAEGGLFSSAMDITIKPARLQDTTYKGVVIKGARLAFAFKDPQSPQATVISQLYGDGIDWRIAAAGQHGVMAMGADASQTIQGLIDQVLSGGPGQVQSEIRAAMDLVPQANGADLVMTLNYPRILGAILSAMMPVPMPQQFFQSSSNVVIAVTADKGKATAQVVVPKAHVQEVAKVFAGMAQAMGQGPRPSTQ